MRVLITAGPTREPIDQVRYLSNRSSGRLGIALAEAAATAGHSATLLLGPVERQPADSTQIHIDRFQTTDELRYLLLAHWPSHDVLIMAAAVADYRPKRTTDVDPVGRPPAKLRRSETGLTLDLEPTPDLLAEAAQLRKPGQTLIGFALESEEDLLMSALKKLQSKKIDAIVANPLATMDADSIVASVVMADESVLDPGGAMTKKQFARWLIDQLPSLMRSEQ